MKKTVFSLLFAAFAAMAAMIAGPALAEGKGLVAFSQAEMTNEWRVMNTKEMEKAWKDAGYEFVWTNANSDPAKQLADVEDLLSRKPESASPQSGDECLDGHRTIGRVMNLKRCPPLSAIKSHFFDSSEGGRCFKPKLPNRDPAANAVPGSNNVGFACAFVLNLEVATESLEPLVSRRKDVR